MHAHPFSLISTLAAISKQPNVSPEAGLAGPAFPSPAFLRGSDALTTAISTFDKYVDSSVPIQSNETAWAVAVFSTNDDEPLYERYYTPEYDVGVPQIDRDSVFRIASVSKVFSVWTFLIEVGDEHFHDPITRYVPELVTAANISGHGAVYDDIDHVRWEEVTLGQLAGQLAGIPRDRRYQSLL
jgi:CubicO group peptidase (beta-lactamase class C family)